MDLIHVEDATIQKTKPARGKGYTAGSSCITNIVMNNREAKIHLSSGSFCTCVGKDCLDKIYTNWQDRLVPIEGIKFSSASQNIHPLGIFKAAIIFPHPTGSIRLKAEFVFMNNCTSQNFILGNDYLNIYGIDIDNHKGIYFTIGENKRQKFAFPLEKREITVIRQVKNVNKGKFVSDQLIEVQSSPELTPEMKRPAYPASPRSREALESHINEPMKLEVLRKVGHNEEVEVTTPVIITWNNDKSRMVGDFRALNNYTITDRYPIPRIHETLTQLSKERFITSIDSLKGFHKNVLIPHARKLLRIIAHCETWQLHLERLSLVLEKILQVNIKISLKECNFGFHELKALGHVVSGLSLGVDKNKVAAVLPKQMPQNNKEMMSFLGLASYYRQHLKDFAIHARSLYRICDQQTVFEIKQERIQAYEKIRHAMTNAPLLLMPD
ncbi:hypothetical protein O181_120939 [Austropuccinia psidii MF-1]|uniref:Reverse transcriptase domain-containing protein n=1 Tax=Austropuccinia psidii MF-1 TaxID=1389203 RepID=A0A9Q3Q0W1_9BASI|nr:hypothetical protein [Austropuccinia psidii MF-1]